jgi:hypothetical protein
LLGTAHGVVLEDTEAQRFAWIYVLDISAQKLRWPSVNAARFDGASRVVVSLDVRMVAQGTVMIDLQTGQVTRHLERRDP